MRESSLLPSSPVWRWRFGRGLPLRDALCLLLLFLVGFAGSSLGEKESATVPDQAAWRVWLEPRFLRTPTAQPIPGAERTVMVPGRLEDDGLKAFTTAEWKALGVTWDEFFQRARHNAETDLAALAPKYQRDRRQVIDHAVLQSPQPIVASAVLAPKFLELFQNTLGPKVLVVVPNRYTAYVFPHLASNYQDYAPGVFADYRATAHPVSVEVFEMSAAGLKPIGAYQEP